MSDIVDGLIAEVRRLNMMQEVYQEITTRLQAERDALLADAERYRWLRREDREFINDEMNNVGAVDSIMVCVFDDDCDAISFFEGELDAAIDAARGKT